MEETKQPEQIESTGRLLPNWLSAYLEYTRESESPDSYHVWAGLSDIASVLRRNVWLDQGLYVLFPNLYVAYVGPPARTGKSTAMWLARQLLHQVPNIKIGPDSCSKEQLIRKMGESKFNNQCALTIHSSEFSSLVEVSGVQMIQFLTDIFDGNYTPPGGWTYETKTQGKDTLINPVLNLLYGTTPSYFAESMPADVIGNGFTSRTIIVYEEKERLINPRPNPNDAELGQALVHDLRHISQLYGQFKWGSGGTDAYDAFYRKLYENIPDDHRIQGYHWRKKIHVLKVAMLLSAAENDSLEITARDINAADQFLSDLEQNMPKAFSAVGKYDYAQDLERIAQQILNHTEGLPISMIFNKNYFTGSADTIREILAMLSSMNLITLAGKDGEMWATPTGKVPPWGHK
jgi:hypothetical protein